MICKALIIYTIQYSINGYRIEYCIHLNGYH